MRRFAFGYALALSAAVVLSVLQGCSVYMEATRPTPVDLDEYQIGQSRDSVLERLGAPESTAKESDGASCDFYRLYTKGYGAGGKIPLAVAEGAADVFTLGLAEVVLTPTEGVTKNEKHPVAICYRDDRIARITTDTGPSAASAEAAISNPSAVPAPIANSTQSATTPGPAIPAPQNVAAANTAPSQTSNAPTVSAASTDTNAKTSPSGSAETRK
jgi:outer membrane protein assembly factor BamE (lipoprotein component of BamABCDE complex)